MYSSKDLTEELQKLSGWKPDNKDGYSSEFILEQLPAGCSVYSPEDQDFVVGSTGNAFSSVLVVRGETYADAAATLAIKLIKQGKVKANV